MPIRTNFHLLLALSVVLLTAAPAAASAALTIDDARVGAQPAYVRVVLDLSGGTAQINEAEATDHAVRDGSARVDVSMPGSSRRRSTAARRACACASRPPVARGS